MSKTNKATEAMKGRLENQFDIVLVSQKVTNDTSHYTPKIKRDTRLVNR